MLKFWPRHFIWRSKPRILPGHQLRDVQPLMPLKKKALVDDWHVSAGKLRTEVAVVIL